MEGGDVRVSSERQDIITSLLQPCSAHQPGQHMLLLVAAQPRTKVDTPPHIPYTIPPHGQLDHYGTFDFSL